MVNLYGVVVLDHPPIVQLLVDFVFPQSMFDVVILYLILPTVVEVVDFAGYLPTHLNVERLVHLRKASLAEY